MSGARVRLAIIGSGKIACDQHRPALDARPEFELAATVDPAGAPIGNQPHFESFDALLASDCAFDAVAICTPPQRRYEVARSALNKGKHVLLEKPPGATLAEVAALEASAKTMRVSLFAAWHSRFAAGVAPAKAWLAGKRIRSVTIVWREDVRVWHPGQRWIWQAGGFGVFDPGINALSIATEILPRCLLLQQGLLQFPSNRDAPVAGLLHMEDTTGVPVTLELDFLQAGPQTWDISVETDSGRLVLKQGGSVLVLPDGTVCGADREYAGIYERFAELIAKGESEVDIAPLRLVADAFLRCRFERVDEFHE